MITKDYHRTLFLSMILIALGVSISTTMGDSSGTIGTVMIAVGGLFFIIGMTKEENLNKKITTQNHRKVSYDIRWFTDFSLCGGLSLSRKFDLGIGRFPPQ